MNTLPISKINCVFTMNDSRKSDLKTVFTDKSQAIGNYQLLIYFTNYQQSSTENIKRTPLNVKGNTINS